MKHLTKKWQLILYGCAGLGLKMLNFAQFRLKTYFALNQTKSLLKCSPKTIHACGLQRLTLKGGSILLRLKASYYFYTSQGAANTKIDLASK